MVQAVCGTVDQWLHDIASAQEDAILPEVLVGHVTVCPRCRGRLLIMMAARSKAWLSLQGHHCTATEEQLPMLVDYERARGLVAAAQAFPAVWWATTVCARCAHAYAELHEVVSLDVPVPATLPIASAGARIQLRVPAALLRRFTGAQPRLGVAWSRSHSDLMLGEEEHDGYRLQIYLRRKHASQLTIEIRTEPPTRGIASLSVAHKVFYRPLDSEGSAVFSDLAEDFFTTSSDLYVTLDTLF